MDARVTIHKCSNIKRRDVESHLILFSPETGLLLELNPTAKFIWEICGGKTVEEIQSSYAQEFGIGLKEAIGDVDEILQILKNKGYVS